MEYCNHAEEISGASEALGSVLRQKVFPFVQGPGQYMGGELNSVDKSQQLAAGQIRGRYCMIFPDTYSIGMSCHAVQVLYKIVNSMSDWFCERSFAPQTDMEQLMRSLGLPWFSWETSSPLADFDVLGFTLQHELCYSNVLTILDLAHIPVLAADRTESSPLIVGGGPCAWSPEPMADFFDAFIVGDGEESLPAVCKRWLELKHQMNSSSDSNDRISRQEALRLMAIEFPFLYVPSCYRPDENGFPVPIDRDSPNPQIPAEITPAVVDDLEKFPSPEKPVVPWVEAVQDRVAVEVMRGCPWRCRFCQSNPIKRPLRIRKRKSIIDSIEKAVQSTGYEEVSLLSLSTGDYPHINDLITELDVRLSSCGVAVAVPSLRINRHLSDLGEVLRTQKSSGLTLAVEAAKEDMRTIIGKPITNDDLFEGCRIAFSRGFQRVKMYFMCGFPGERNDDLDGIIELAETVARLGKEVSGRWPKVVVSVSNLVPKPHTPFQWYPMQTRDYFYQASRYLRNRRLPASIQVKTHDVAGSLLEGVFCRGDRRLGAAILEAWRLGARFDSWSEQFNPALWEQAFENTGLDVSTFLHTTYTAEHKFPWDIIRIRQGRQYLQQQFEQSQKEIQDRQPLADTSQQDQN